MYVCMYVCIYRNYIYIYMCIYIYIHIKHFGLGSGFIPRHPLFPAAYYPLL